MTKHKNRKLSKKQRTKLDKLSKACNKVLLIIIAIFSAIFLIGVICNFITKNNAFATELPSPMERVILGPFATKIGASCDHISADEFTNRVNYVCPFSGEGTESTQNGYRCIIEFAETTCVDKNGDFYEKPKTTATTQTCQVTLNGNGAGGFPGYSVVAMQITETLNKNAVLYETARRPSRPGYTFDGWSKTANGAKLPVGALIDCGTSAGGSVTYYALWKADNTSTSPGTGTGSGSGSSSSGGASTSTSNCKTYFKWDAGENCPSIGGLIMIIYNWISIGVGVAVVIGLIIGGIMYSTAQGDQAQAKKGIDQMRNALIALGLYFFIWALLNFLVPGGLFDGNGSILTP